MPLRPLPLHSRNLTGQRRIFRGPFGLAFMQVQIAGTETGVRQSLYWSRCKSQREWEYCDQFEQKDHTT